MSPKIEALCVYIRAEIARMGECEVMTTREFSKRVAFSVRDCYTALSSICDEGLICKYGYRVRGGWEDPAHTSRKCDSLGWQKCNP